MLVVGACGGDEDEGGEAPSAESFLFVQTAGGATLDTRDGSLALSDASPAINYFSDRPERIAGQTSLGAFADGWRSIFGDDPPNAAVQQVAGPNEASPAVVELLEPPAYEGGRTVNYAVRLVDPSGELDDVVRFDEVSLFIDAGDAVASGTVGNSCNPIIDPRCKTAPGSTVEGHTSAGCNPFTDPRC